MTTATVKKRGASRKAEGSKRTLTPEQERAVRAQVDADAEGAAPLAMAAYTEAFTLYLHHADALKVARRCTEIWNASKGRDGEGANYFREQVDAAMEAGDNIMVASPAFDLFPFLFVRAAADWKGSSGPNHYTRLLDLIRRVDAGEDLDQIAADTERRGDEKRAAMEAAELAKPEPKDKTSDGWRYWQLRHIEAGMASDGEAARVEARGAFWSFFDSFKKTLLSRGDYTVEDVSAARGLLPQLIINWQKTERRPKKRKARK
jgi:hypothetical protein